MIYIQDVTPDGSHIHDLPSFPTFGAAVIAAKGRANERAKVEGGPLMIVARDTTTGQERAFIARA